MRKLILFSLCGVFAAALCGCTSTSSTILEYDAEGRLVKRTDTSESVIKTITESTKNKTVIAWDNSWLAGISASTATTEDPTPTVKILAGRNDKGVINLLPSHGIAALKDIIPAIRAGDLSVSPTSITSSSKEVSK